MHRVDAPAALRKLSASSKMNAEPEFLLHLKELGRNAAHSWLASGLAKVGVETGIDLDDEVSYALKSPMPAYVPERAHSEMERGARRPGRKPS
jgi:NTE family protein